MYSTYSRVSANCVAERCATNRLRERERENENERDLEEEEEEEEERLHGEHHVQEQPSPQHHTDRQTDRHAH